MSDIVNCSQCGRDTRRACGICRRCGDYGTDDHSEMKGRKVLQVDGDNPMKTLGFDCEDDYSEDSNPDSVVNEGNDLKSFNGRFKPGGKG